MTETRPHDVTAIKGVLESHYKAWDAAVAVSEAGIRFPGETEVPADRMVYATWVLEKRDGAWLVAAYHNSPAVLPS